MTSPFSLLGRARLNEQVRDAMAPLGFLALLSVGLWWYQPRFLSLVNLQDLARETSVVAILAVGQTVVIIAAQIDLSVGSNLAFAGCMAGVAMRDHHFGVIAAIAVACASGSAIGVVNGLVTAYGRIPSFIVTLGAMLACRGLALIVSNSINISPLAPGFEVFGSGGLFQTRMGAGLPWAFVIMIVCAIIIHVVLSATRWGRSVYAVGGNREAARLSGINMRWMTVSIMTLMGFVTGIAAVIDVSRAGVAQPTAGAQMELWSIAATVMGGTSLFGGTGGIPGAIIGAFLMSVIQNGCDLA
ncbi:MAG: ABC transporter permease, partial [Armatimonadetes bacterium]|nr:ABC transporter permease [Armatimonadota bacterium]